MFSAADLFNHYCYYLTFTFSFVFFLTSSLISPRHEREFTKRKQFRVYTPFTLEVSNKMGVHARPAAMIVRITSRYEGEIWVTKEDEQN